SVWQMPVALISTITSPAFGPSRLTSMISSGLPASSATAARVLMVFSLDCGRLARHGCRKGPDGGRPPKAVLLGQAYTSSVLNLPDFLATWVAMASISGGDSAS